MTNSKENSSAPKSNITENDLKIAVIKGFNKYDEGMNLGRHIAQALIVKELVKLHKINSDK